MQGRVYDVSTVRPGAHDAEGCADPRQNVAGDQAELPTGRYGEIWGRYGEIWGDMDQAELPTGRTCRRHIRGVAVGWQRPGGRAAGCCAA